MGNTEVDHMEMLSNFKKKYSIGYWANTKRWTLVHINRDGDPVCGSLIKEDLRFQWCANGIQFSLLECGHCKNWWVKKQKEKKHAKGNGV